MAPPFHIDDGVPVVQNAVDKMLRGAMIIKDDLDITPRGESSLALIAKQESNPAAMQARDITQVKNK